jgi:hypothetical protein
MRLFNGNKAVRGFTVTLLSMLFAGALAFAQVPNPAVPGVLGGYDKYANQYPGPAQYFLTSSWSYQTSCLVYNANVQISIASPAVITATNTCAAGQALQFQTTGALPTGLTAGTTYYVIATGLTGSGFEVSTSVGGSAVNTSGTQSGNQSAYTIYTNATTGFTAALQMAPIPPGWTGSGHCTLLWQTSNTSGTPTFGMQPSNTTSTVFVLNTAHTGANGATLADTATTITSSGTPTAISGTMTAGSANTTYRDDVFFEMVTSPAGTAPTLLSFYMESSNTSYTASLMPGSVCTWGP